jgi:hypothetical protein
MRISFEPRTSPAGREARRMIQGQRYNLDAVHVIRHGGGEAAWMVEIKPGAMKRKRPLV